MEIIILAIFALSLTLCVIFDVSILIALVFGYLLFFGYGLYRRHSPKVLLKKSLSGILTVKNILLTFILIGMITAVWRAGGTIPYIIYHASGLCTPPVMLPLTFLLCCMMSVLTGTAFGTAATVGVICAAMAHTMSIPVYLTGGAVLAGSFFGDRCSPMSTSALLVSELTKTDIYTNIVGMVKTSVVPFVLSCAAYLGLGLMCGASENTADVAGIFEANFNLTPIVLIPVAAIIILSLLRINVKIAMSVSIVSGFVTTLLTQDIGFAELLRSALTGYNPTDSELAALLSGGGITSMAKVFCIVCLSSCYSGIFRETGFLDGIRRHIDGMATYLTPFGCVLCTSLVCGMVACNQTLCIMLTDQLCGQLYPDKNERAIVFENTAVVVSPLIPWSIAAGVPLTSAGSSSLGIVFAVYLWVLPLWELVRRAVRGVGGVKK